MTTTVTDIRKRVIYGRFDRHQVKALVLAKVSEETGIAVSVLRASGEVKLVEETEGSPSYVVGYGASYKGEIPLDA